MITIYDACEEATIDIWDDREAYILAVLARLQLDPAADFDKYLLYQRFGSA
jgi:hypothetical protein